MGKAFLAKLLNNAFEDLITEELKAIINNENVFSLSKKDITSLRKIIENDALESAKDKVAAILSKGLPTPFVLLHNLDKYSINEGKIQINFREALLNNLNKMNNLQLCVFINKILLLGKQNSIRFFRHREYSLHEINSVVSKSFGLSLVFEIFKEGKAKNFTAIDYNQIDKKLLIDTLNSELTRYLYVLEIVSEIVLATEEKMILGTKINKTIKEQTNDYISIIIKEKKTVKETGIKPKKTWTYTLGNLGSIVVEDDEYVDEEEDFYE